RTRLRRQSRLRGPRSLRRLISGPNPPVFGSRAISGQARFGTPSPALRFRVGAASALLPCAEATTATGTQSAEAAPSPRRPPAQSTSRQTVPTRSVSSPTAARYAIQYEALHLP